MQKPSSNTILAYDLFSIKKISNFVEIYRMVYIFVCVISMILRSVLL